LIQDRRAAHEENRKREIENQQKQATEESLAEKRMVRTPFYFLYFMLYQTGISFSWPLLFGFLLQLLNAKKEEEEQQNRELQEAISKELSLIA
jgi:hypothetical protein